MKLNYSIFQEIPYNEEIPDGLQPGKMLRLQGVTQPDADRYVNLSNIDFLPIN